MYWVPNDFIVHLDSTGMGSAWCRKSGPRSGFKWVAFKNRLSCVYHMSSKCNLKDIRFEKPWWDVVNVEKKAIDRSPSTDLQLTNPEVTNPELTTCTEQLSNAEASVQVLKKENIALKELLVPNKEQIKGLLEENRTTKHLAEELQQKINHMYQLSIFFACSCLGAFAVIICYFTANRRRSTNLSKK